MELTWWQVTELTLAFCPILITLGIVIWRIFHITTVELPEQRRLEEERAQQLVKEAQDQVELLKRKRLKWRSDEVLGAYKGKQIHQRVGTVDGCVYAFESVAVEVAPGMYAADSLDDQHLIVDKLFLYRMET